MKILEHYVEPAPQQHQYRISNSGGNSNFALVETYEMVKIREWGFLTRTYYKDPQDLSTWYDACGNPVMFNKVRTILGHLRIKEIKDHLKIENIAWRKLTQGQAKP